MFIDFISKNIRRVDLKKRIENVSKFHIQTCTPARYKKYNEKINRSAVAHNQNK